MRRSGGRAERRADLLVAIAAVIDPNYVVVVVPPRVPIYARDRGPAETAEALGLPARPPPMPGECPRETFVHPVLGRLPVPTDSGSDQRAFLLSARATMSKARTRR